MNSPTNAKPNVTKNKIPPIAIALVTLVVVVGLVWGGITWFKANHAEEVARPLEQSLISMGAIKKCSQGDPGRGPDNLSPWINVYYELPLGREQAIATITKIAQDNGYNLTHASPSNRGHLGAVADLHIGNWYFDNTSKQSPYQDLQPGQIELAFGVNNDGTHELSHISCQTEEAVVINSGAAQSMISIEVKLPEFKH